MIYIYRILWLLFYIPIFIFEMAMFTLSIPVFFIACAVYYIKTGNIEETPDGFLPWEAVVKIDYWYKGLQK